MRADAVGRVLGAAALVGCLGLLLLQLSIGFPYQFSGLFSDGISYLYMADIVSGREPATQAIALQHWRYSQFPPGYPVVLALFGADSGNPGRGLVLQAAIALFASLGLAFYLRKLVGGFALALMLLLPCLLMPWHLPWTLEIASEPLFLALLLGVLLLGQSELPDDRKLLAMALVCAMLCLVRNAGLPMLPAIIAWAVHRRLSASRIVAASLLVLAPLLAWALYKRSMPIGASYADALPLLLEGALNDPLALVSLQAHAFLAGLAFNPQAGAGGLVFAALLLVLALPSIWQRSRQGELDGYFLALYLTLALVWPYPAESSRLLGVVQPLLLAQAFITLRSALQSRAAAAAGLTPALAACSICLLLTLLSPGALATLARARQPAADPGLEYLRRSAGWFLSADPDAYAESAHRLILLAGRSAQVVPADACIYTTQPSLVSLHSHRMTLVTPKVVVSETGVPTAGRCAYFLVTAMASLQGRLPPLHPLGSDAGRLQPIMVSVREQGGQRIIEAALMRWAIAPPSASGVNSPGEK